MLSHLGYSSVKTFLNVLGSYPFCTQVYSLCGFIILGVFETLANYAANGMIFSKTGLNTSDIIKKGSLVQRKHPETL